MSSSLQVEKVARALYVQSGMTYNDANYWNDMARVAIEAMRYLTAEMERAAHQAAVAATGKTVGEFVSDGSSWPLFLRPKVLWEAAIDEALKEAA
jgi:hypothetical protein